MHKMTNASASVAASLPLRGRGRAGGNGHATFLLGNFCDCPPPPPPLSFYCVSLPPLGPRGRRKRKRLITVIKVRDSPSIFPNSKALRS